MILVDEINNILFGVRSDGQGFCLAGGKIDPGETSREAAIRETKEEFNVVVNSCEFMTVITSKAKVHGKLRNVKSVIYLSSDYILPSILEPNREMESFMWLPLEKALIRKDLFEPTRVALSKINTFGYLKGVVFIGKYNRVCRCNNSKQRWECFNG